jgi:hypothetical protein
MLYKLYVDAGDDFNSAFTIIPRYDGQSSTFVAITTSDSLTVGKVYRFVYVATNSLGDSD